MLLNECDKQMNKQTTLSLELLLRLKTVFQFPATLSRVRFPVLRLAGQQDHLHILHDLLGPQDGLWVLCRVGWREQVAEGGAGLPQHGHLLLHHGRGCHLQVLLAGRAHHQKSI